MSNPCMARWSGMTLVEMLVATTMSLIIMGAVAQLFSVLGRNVSDNQGAITMNEQLRGVAQQLRRDLGGITVTTLPPVRPDADSGYLEIIEGPATDLPSGTASLNGDCDDALTFTTKSLDKPFTGLFSGTRSLESQYAEVAWFCKQSVDQPLTAYGTTLYTLYRRQLLSMAYVGTGAFQSNNSIAWPGSWDAFYADYDLSCRPEIAISGTILCPNSLGDLTKRENRFMHNVPGVSGTFNFFSFAGASTPGAVFGLGSSREGCDVVLRNVVSFDVRVFDPSVPVRAQPGGTVGLLPDDVVYGSGTASGTGGYVNVGWGGSGSPSAVGATFPPATQTAFQSSGVYVTNAPRDLPLNATTFDTWSLHYEFNGINEDNDFDGAGNPLIDEGTNGQDDNKNGIIDDPAEAETSPPYPVPLRGLEIRIRCYEPSSRQVRQVTVRHTFVPH
jgi:type II secretory pathway pseudopilin PulG